MSDNEAETGIPDDQLPADLVPADNPLAEGLDAGETVDDLLTDGKTPEQDDSDDSDDSDDADDSADDQPGED